MERRHEDELTKRLEQILTDGCTYISWNELYHWYGMQKLAAGTYRDLSQRWDDLTKTTKSPDGKPLKLGKLMFVQSPFKVTPGIYLFGEKMPKAVFAG